MHLSTLADARDPAGFVEPLAIYGNHFSDCGISLITPKDVIQGNAAIVSG